MYMCTCARSRIHRAASLRQKKNSMGEMWTPVERGNICPLIYNELFCFFPLASWIIEGARTLQVQIRDFY